MMRAFVQARMSSRRFPGKVLAPFRGEPLIRRVLAAVETALPSVVRTVVTSLDRTDDPLAAYLESEHIDVFRGPLDDVFERFRMAQRSRPCDWILRVNADSPLLDPRVVRAVAARTENADVVTTIQPRTFPRGWNAEAIRTQALLEVDSELTPEEREHVTPYFYRNPDRYRIVNVASGSPDLERESLAVDTLEDLRRLEVLGESELRRLAAKVKL